MLNRLPELIDPLVLADRRASLEGELPISELTRLGELLYSNEGQVAVNLFFGRLGKLATIEGHISAILALKCQRCLEALPWTINGNIKLGIVGSLAQADKLPEAYDPLLLENEDKIQLKNIVEDEILLSLPSIPKHENTCSVPYASNIKPVKESKITPQKVTENPFSVLTELKNQIKLETTHGSTKE